MGEEKSIVQMGGLGGLLAGIVLIISALLLGSSGGPGTTEEVLIRNSEVGRVFLLFPGVSLAAFLLSVPLFLALHRVSKRTGPAPALLGGVLGVSGALVMAANWALILVGAPFLADLHAAATDADKPAILIAAQAWEQVTHGFQFFGGLLIGLAFASFGWALLARPDVRGYGWASLVLGLLVAASWLIVVGIGGETGPVIAFLVIGFLAIIPLFLLLGWKVYSLSRAA